MGDVVCVDCSKILWRAKLACYCVFTSILIFIWESDTCACGEIDVVHPSPSASVCKKNFVMSKVLLLIMLSILVNTVSGDEVLDRDHGIPGRNGDTAKTRIEIVSYQKSYLLISV